MNVKLPRLVVAAATLCLFLLALLSVRLYGTLGEPINLGMAIAAGLGCLLIVFSIIHANYTPYRRPPQRRLNGS